MSPEFLTSHSGERWDSLDCALSFPFSTRTFAFLFGSLGDFALLINAFYHKFCAQFRTPVLHFFLLFSTPPYTGVVPPPWLFSGEQTSLLNEVSPFSQKRLVPFRAASTP